MKKIILSVFLFGFSFLSNETEAAKIPLGGSCGNGKGTCVTNSDFQEFDLNPAFGGENCDGLGLYCATNASIEERCDVGHCGKELATVPVLTPKPVIPLVPGEIIEKKQEVEEQREVLPTKGEISQAEQTTTLDLFEGSYDSLLSKNIVAKKISGDSIEAGRNLLQGDFLKLINMMLGVFAIVWLGFLGASFVVSRGEEEKMSELKKQAGWIILGLAVIAVSEFAAFRIFDPAGYKILDETGAVDNFYLKIMQIKTYFEYFVLSVMLASLLISGYSLVVRFDNDEVMANEKKFVISFVFGMGLILLAEVAVRIIAIEGNGAGATTKGIGELAGIINFASTFLGVSSVLMLILSSIYYVLSLGSEDQTGKAKNIIIGSIVGIVIAVSSYAISMFLI